MAGSTTSGDEQERFTHTDSRGKAKMVDISGKKPQLRFAAATGHITMQEKTIKLLRENEIEKGDVLTVAEIAGIQAAKRTPELIPLCHPIHLSKVDVSLELVSDGVRVESSVQCVDRTGAEMEALVAVTTALLTVYDMCKAVDSHMTIDEVKLLEKKKF